MEKNGARERIVAAYRDLYKKGKVTLEDLQGLVAAGVITEEEYQQIIA